MENNLDQLLNYLPISIFLLQIFLGAVSIIFDVVFLISWLIAARKMVKHTRKIKRVYPLWSKPLTPEQIEYLKNLPDGGIEQPRQRVVMASRSAALLMKANNEVMISGGIRIRSTTISFSDGVPMANLIGYANLAQSAPILEFRIPLKKTWVIIFIIVNLLGLPSTLPFGMMPFFMLFIVLTVSAEGIESFLKDKSTDQNKSTKS